MDLGLKGKKAIVCAASKGLGRGCAVSLSRAGVDLVIVARTPGPLEQTAREIGEASGVTVTPTSRRRRAGPWRSRPVPSRISWSTTPAARRRATSAIGRATTGSRPSTPTC